MTQEKLKQGNEIDRQINHHKAILKDLKTELKNFLLDDFSPQTTLYFNSSNPHQNCAVFNKERVEKFIEKEVEILKNELEILEKEFQQL